MEIDNTINKWSKDVQSKLAEEECTEVRDFCCSVSAVLKTYCDATARLLKDEPKILPAMALLRIISELVIKFIWCTENNDKELEERLKRWEKRSAKNKKRLDKGLLPIVGDGLKTALKNDIEKIEELIGEYEKWGIKFIPNTIDLFEKLKASLGFDAYISSYLQFNSAVHIDTHILASTVKRLDGKKYFEGDWEENIDKLKLHCLSSLYYFLKATYKEYNWNCDGIDREHADIVKKLSDEK